MASAACRQQAGRWGGSRVAAGHRIACMQVSRQGGSAGGQRHSRGQARGPRSAAPGVLVPTAVAYHRGARVARNGLRGRSRGQVEQGCNAASKPAGGRRHPLPPPALTTATHLPIRPHHHQPRDACHAELAAEPLPQRLRLEGQCQPRHLAKVLLRGAARCRAGQGLTCSDAHSSCTDDTMRRPAAAARLRSPGTAPGSCRRSQTAPQSRRAATAPAHTRPPARV